MFKTYRTLKILITSKNKLVIKERSYKNKYKSIKKLNKR